MLRYGNDIRHGFIVLEAEQFASLAEPGLRLVEDQQHAAAVEFGAQRLEVAGRGYNHAAGAENGLADEGSGLGREVGVGEFEAGMEALQLAAREAEAQWAAVAMGGEDCRG